MAGFRFYTVFFGLLAMLLAVGGLAWPPTPSQAQAGATISVRPETAPQNAELTITLENFQLEEPVTLWLTLPDFSIEEIGDYAMPITGEPLVVTYRMAPSRPIGLYSISARGNWSGREASTQFELTLGEGVPPDSQVSLTQDDPAPRQQGEEFVFLGGGYQPRERVSLWINLPNDTMEDRGHVFTDSEGNFVFTLVLDSNYPVGTYKLSARGNDSGLTGITEFRLTYGELPTFDLPVLFINPSQVRQFDPVRIEGQNFAADELISVWVTLETGRVVFLRETTSDGEGAFAFIEVLDAARFPVGRHQVTAFGNNSLLVAVGLVQVEPGTGPGE